MLREPYPQHIHSCYETCCMEMIVITQLIVGGDSMYEKKRNIEHDEVQTDKDMIVEKGMPPEILARHENDSNPDAYDLRDPKQLNAD
jgi:hypothetical protein